MGLSLKSLCKERNKSVHDVAVACGVTTSLVYRWFAGDEKASLHHRGALAGLIGEAEVRAYYAAWPVLAKGRPMKGARLILMMRRVARGIRERGKAELADELVKLADEAEREDLDVHEPKESSHERSST